MYDILQENLTKLNNFKTLGKGWNGYDVDPFETSFINAIIELLPYLDKQPTLFPTARNSIQFEYIINFENYFNTYVEIEIYEDSYSIFIQNDEKEFIKEIEISEVISISVINEILTGFHKGVSLLD